MNIVDRSTTIRTFCFFLSTAVGCAVTGFGLTSLGNESQRPAPNMSTDEDTEPNKEAAVLPGTPQLKNEDSQDAQSTDENSPDVQKRKALEKYMEGVAAQKDGRLEEALKLYREASSLDPKAPEPVRAAALLLMRLGRQIQAIQEAGRAIQLDPDDYETRIQLAVLILAGRGDTSNAAALIEQALSSKRLVRESPEYVSIHVVRGRLYLELQDAEKAVESYKVILDALENPDRYGLDAREHQRLLTDRATGYETIGRIMLQVGQYEDARRAFEGLVRMNEDQPGEHHYLLALVQYRMDELDECEKNLNRYFESGQRSRESLQLLSDLYHATSRADRLLEKLEQLAQDTAEASVVRLFIGEHLLDQGQPERAAEIFRKVIEDTGDVQGYLGLIRVAVFQRSPKDVLTHLNRALRARIQLEELQPLLQLMENDPEFAKQTIDAAIESLTDNKTEPHPVATYLFSLLADSEHLNLPEKELKLLEATLKQNPPPAIALQARSRLGLSLYAAGKYQEAAETFRILLQVPGLPRTERVMTLYRLSAVESELKNFDAAIAAVNEALELVPGNPQLLYQRGLIQIQAKRYAAAEETLKEAIRASTGDVERSAQAHLLLGSLYSQQGRWDEAVKVYQAVLKMADVDADHLRRAKIALSNALVQSGNMRDGERILEEVYAEHPDDPGVNNDLGYLYAEQNKNLEKAEKMTRLAVEAEPKNPAYLDSLGWVLYRLGRYDEALEILQQANSNPDYRDSTIIEHLGDVYQALGRIEDARKAWREAAEVEQQSASPNREMLNRLNKKISDTAEKTTPPEAPSKPNADR